MTYYLSEFPMKIARTNISDEVATWLTEAIENGRFKPGDRLPSVAQLAKELGVGRSSIREALRHQRALGLIELQQGKGTFVTASKPIQLGSCLNSFSESIRERGMEPGAVLLRREIVEADETVQEYLKLAEGEQINLLYRLRLADGEPLAIEISYTPYKFFPDLLEGSWSLNRSLYETLTQTYNVILSHAQQTVGATLITVEQSHLLQVKQGSPAIEVHTVVYGADGTPIEYGLSVYRGDRYKYTVTLRSRS
jgi:GntR family transcriptional regulator